MTAATAFRRDGRCRAAAACGRSLCRGRPAASINARRTPAPYTFCVPDTLRAIDGPRQSLFRFRQMVSQPRNLFLPRGRPFRGSTPIQAGIRWNRSCSITGRAFRRRARACSRMVRESVRFVAAPPGIRSRVAGGCVCQRQLRDRFSAADDLLRRGGGGRCPRHALLLHG